MQFGGGRLGSRHGWDPARRRRAGGAQISIFCAREMRGSVTSRLGIAAAPSAGLRHGHRDGPVVGYLFGGGLLLAEDRFG